MNQKTYDRLSDKKKLTFCTEMITESSMELNEIPDGKEKPMDCSNPLMAYTLIEIITVYKERRDALMEKLSIKVKKAEDKFCKDNGIHTSEYRGADYGND